MPDNATYGTGRRKSSVAKVWLFPGSGKMVINNKELLAYFGRSVLVDQVQDPIKTVNLDGKYDIRISANGGGLAGQAGAAQMGLARAILVMNEEFRKALKPQGFLTRDMRVKERKKYGRRKARKGPQYRKR